MGLKHDDSPPSASAAPEDVAKELQQKLLVEFGVVLDEPLILLIANERDIVHEYEEIREILNQLAEPAKAEALTGFDPSGLSSATDSDGAFLESRNASRHDGDGSAEYATTISEFSDLSEPQKLTDRTNLSDEEKIQELKLVFQDRWGDHTLRFVIKENDGDLDRALEGLLTRQMLEEEGSLPKGVDGFFTPDQDGPAPRGKAGRGKKRKGAKAAKKEVVAVHYKTVSPTVNEAELESAKDFARPNNTAGCGLLLQTSTPTFRSSPAAAALTSPISTDFGASHLRSAATLRRLGPLGRQGAVVYTDRARDERAAFTAQVSQAAEQHVAQQSTSTSVDLHGVFVMDGVRIAKKRVWAWWEGLGEERKTIARRQGFTVVTGVGKHSAGGVSRMRQVVGAFLKNDGWRVEVLTGSFLVTGRV
ncbi:hypothetical protein B0J18DRAFT_273572 [Chaetomium sp. MPI-SDFR-AT-0129]|nr:hypothetical protein B0J18DRAFT_273572 [Chaetomium sp. MPI-SDFR-AT-0129]